MRRRRQQSPKRSESRQIEWLKHRTGYPSPEEREKIILMRQDLTFELVKLAVTGNKPNDARIQALIREYGAQEVERATSVLGESMDIPSRVADDASSYRDYRLRYARFGAGLKFFTAQEVDDLYKDNIGQLKNLFLRQKTVETPEPEKDLNKLLLMGWNEWKDITPPAIPPRPVDFHAPQPVIYPAPVNQMLEWGFDLGMTYHFENKTEHDQWRKHIPALTRMALDPGLLQGWPSEPASWAPWRAIHMLGTLQAWESAPALAQLADIENDWLSDHLPHIFAGMGAQVEPALWMILENASASGKQRGLAAEALLMMAEDNEALENQMIRGFEKLLQNKTNFDPALNAYLIAFLDRLDAIEEVRAAILTAFAEDRVDTTIFGPEDLNSAEFDDFEDADDLKD